MKQKKAYSYIRFSSALQAKGKSFERQLENSKGYCEKHGLELVENYTDLGVSAFKGNNKDKVNALGKFLEAVQTGKIEKDSWLIVENLDRISREKPRKAFEDFSKMLDYGLTIVTLQDNQVYTKDTVDNEFTSLLASVMLMFKAHRESADKSKRVLDAKNRIRKDAAEGKRIITKVCPSWLKAKDDYKGFEVIEEKAKTVRYIFNLVKEGHGTIAITRILNEKKIPVISGKKSWKEVYVKKILKNKSVYGLYTFHKTGETEEETINETIENYFPVVVDKDTFEDVQVIQENRTNLGGRKGSAFNNLFKHLLVCKHCGSPLHYKNHGNKYKDYVICSSSLQGTGCNASRFMYESLEIYVLQLIEEIDLKRFLSTGNDDFIAEKYELIKILEAENYVDEQKIKGFQEQMILPDFLPEMLVMINQSLKIFKEAINERTLKINQYRKELNDIKPNSDTLYIIENFLKLRKQFKEAKEIERFELRSELNHYMKSIISSIEVSTYNKNDIEPFFPPLIESQTNEAKKMKKENTERYRNAFAELESQNHVTINLKTGKSITINFYKEFYKGTLYEVGYCDYERYSHTIFLNSIRQLERGVVNNDENFNEFMNNQMDDFLENMDKIRNPSY
jgi:DNA invertase Pin-like site-specific DNA recombinase